MQRTVSKRLQLVEPTVEAARAAASGTFKDAPTSSVLTLNPVPFSCLFHLNATAYLYPVVLAAFPLTQWDPMELIPYICCWSVCSACSSPFLTLSISVLPIWTRRPSALTDLCLGAGRMVPWDLVVSC